LTTKRKIFILRYRYIIFLEYKICKIYLKYLIFKKYLKLYKYIKKFVGFMTPFSHNYGPSQFVVNLHLTYQYSRLWCPPSLSYYAFFSDFFSVNLEDSNSEMIIVVYLSVFASLENEVFLIIVNLYYIIKKKVK